MVSRWSFRPLVLFCRKLLKLLKMEHGAAAAESVIEEVEVDDTEMRP